MGVEAEVDALLGALAAGITEVGPPVEAVPMCDEAAADPMGVQGLAGLGDQLSTCAICALKPF